MRILVTGATGYIGGRLVPLLLKKGHAVRCMARRPEHLIGRGWDGAEISQGDVLDPSTLPQNLAGIDIAYYLIHSMSSGGHDFENRDRKAAQFFAEAARAAGVKRIIYLGGLGRDEDSLSPHLRSRHEVGDILRSSGILVTEFRAAIIVGSGSVSFEIIRYLTERLPIMICPKWVYTRCQPIAIRDLLSYLVQAIDCLASQGRILEIGGADIITYHDMMLGYAKVRGLKRLLVRIPVLTPRLSSYWLDLITPIPASIARPLILGLKNDVVCQNKEALEIFPIRPIGYLEAVRLALERIEGFGVETTWHGSLSSTQGDQQPPIHLIDVEGMIRETEAIEIKASADRVFEVFSSLGGKSKWLFANWTWALRGLLDRLLGGVGMRRGRRHPKELLPGDVVDFWRVEKVERNQLLLMRAEMKLPGRAWLQFGLMPIDTTRVRLIQTAFFEPKGLAGLLYWYALYPIHKILFRGLCRKIREKSES